MSDLPKDFVKEEKPFILWRLASHSTFWPVLVFVILVVALGVAVPGQTLADGTYSQGFLELSVRDGHLFGQPMDILRYAAPPLLLSIGMCLVIATGGIDLSVGAVMAMSVTFSLTYLIHHADTAETLPTVLAAVGIGLLVGVAVGLFNGLMVAQLGIQPFIATLILMVGGRGIAMVVTQGRQDVAKSALFKQIGSGFWFGLPAPIIIALGVFAVAVIAVRKSAFGMLLEALGINAPAARLAGVRSKRVLITVYTVSGALAAIAGMVYGAPMMSTDAWSIGQTKEMDAIMCVVIGGTSLAGGKFSLSGTIIGALILGMLDKAVILLHLPSTSAPLFKALVVIAICVLQSPLLRGAGGRLALRRSSGKEVAA
jgi:simple sugar transport system permease protein